VAPFYRIRFDDGRFFDYSGDGAAMCEQVRAVAPDDVAGYERFLAMSERIFEVGFDRLAHVPFGSWSAMARVVPDMVKLESYRTVYGLVSKFVRNDELRQVLSFHPLLVGGNPFTTTSIYSLIPHLFVWYFGTDRPYGDVAHHSIVLGPRYEALLSDIFRRKVLAPDFSLYLHRPTATDPSLAPPGHDAFYVLSPVPHLDAAVDWSSRAEPYRRAIEKRLEETLLPGLRGHVVTSRAMTPQHFHDELLSDRGAAFGLEPVLTQSAYFRPHNASEEVEGLYLVGAGTHPGAGVPGVLSSARVLDALVPDGAARVA
jgi:phytoene dehydrogenase-like protein